MNCEMSTVDEEESDVENQGKKLYPYRSVVSLFSIRRKVFSVSEDRLNTILNVWL